MARTHHEAPQSSGLEHGGLPAQEPEKSARARKTKPPVPPKAMRPMPSEQAVGDEDIVEQTLELNDDDVMEVKDAEEGGIPAPDGDKPFTRIKPYDPSKQLRADAGTALEIQKKREARDPLFRLEQTAKREERQKEMKGEWKTEAGTSLQLEVMDAWKNYDAAKEAFMPVAMEYDAKYRETMDRLGDPKKNYDEATKDYLLHAIMSKDGLQEKHDQALQAYANAERAYLDRYAQWELELNQKQELKKQYENDFNELVAEVSGAKFSPQEEAWFKKGEDEERQMDAARAEIERSESLVETPAEIEANVAQAAAMLKNGELNPQVFDLNAYQSLLHEKVRLDGLIELASESRKNKARSELKGVMKNLEDYEGQIQSVYSERRGGNHPVTASEKREIAAKPWRTQELPQGSGTTIKKKGFFARLFGR